MKIATPLAKRKNYLLIKISGDYKMDNSFPKLNKIRKECEENGTEKALLDLMDVNFSTIVTMDRFYIGEAVSKIFGPQIKAAFVVAPQFVNKFMETVAVNRGANIKVFDSIDAAEDWLSDK